MKELKLFGEKPKPKPKKDDGKKKELLTLKEFMDKRKAAESGE